MFQSRVYVPNSEADSVDVIDPISFRIVDHFAVGRRARSMCAAWDLTTLYVTTIAGTRSRRSIPAPAGGAPVAVDDPYNLYFTPDGTKAIVVAERLQRLDFRDPHTWSS